MNWQLNVNFLGKCFIIFVMSFPASQINLIPVTTPRHTPQTHKSATEIGEVKI